MSEVPLPAEVVRQFNQETQQVSAQNPEATPPVNPENVDTTVTSPETPANQVANTEATPEPQAIPAAPESEMTASVTTTENSPATPDTNNSPEGTMPAHQEVIDNDTPYDRLRQEISELIPADGSVPEFTSDQEKKEYIDKLKDIIERGRDIRADMYDDDTVPGSGQSDSREKLDIFNQVAKVREHLAKVEADDHDVEQETSMKKQIEQLVWNVNKQLSLDAPGPQIKDAILQLATLLEQQGLTDQKNELIEAGARLLYGPTRSEGIQRWGELQDDRWQLEKQAA